MELESDSCDSWDVAFEAEQEAEPNHDAPALQEAQDSRDAATQPTLYSHSAQRQRKRVVVDRLDLLEVISLEKF